MNQTCVACGGRGVERIFDGEGFCYRPCSICNTTGIMSPASVPVIPTTYEPDDEEVEEE